MNKAIAQTIHIEKALFATLAFTCIMLFALYVYFVSASVVHVVMRTEISQEITKISSEISELEGEYIEAQHRVSSDIASLQGYTQTQSKVFIDKTPSSLVLNTGTGQ
jgi:uncharacterized membrane-anchored protein YitT (DUF2179 family)